MSDEPRETLLREFPVEVSEGGDGRTLEARIVPYNTPTQVVDRVENGGTGVPYMESWAPGAFDRQSGAMNRVKIWLNFEHEKGLRGIVGHGVELDSRDDALYGTFRVHDNSDGNKALQMVRDGLLTGISLEAFPVRTRRTTEGIVERVRAHLEKVSLCRVGAFAEAAVLALREEPPPEDEPKSNPTYFVGQKGPEVFVPNTDSTADVSLTFTGFPKHGDELVEAVREKLIEAKSPEPSEAALALQRIGFEPLIVRAVVRKPWDGSPSRFDDDQYRRSCLIDRGGDEPVKERCSLPVLEPNGDVNVNALAAAAAALSGARGGLRNVSPADKSKAARKLMRYYGQADMDPPPSLRQVAAR